MSNYGSVTRTQYDAPANGFVLNPYKSVRSIYEQLCGFCPSILLLTDFGDLSGT